MIPRSFRMSRIILCVAVLSAVCAADSSAAFIQNDFNGAADLEVDSAEAEVFQGRLTLSPLAFWTNSVNSILAGPYYFFEDSRGCLFCGTFLASSDGNLFISSNGGTRWTNVIGTRANCMIEASDGNLFSGMGQGTVPGNGSIKKSYDHGVTWSNIYSGFIHGRSIMESSENALYAGISKVHTGPPLISSNKLIRSVNYGTNWTVVFKEGVTGGASEVSFHWLYEMENGNFLGGKVDFTGVFTRGVYVSSNKGTNWSLISVTSNKHYANKIFKGSDNALYLCGTNGIIKTSDQARNFQNVSSEFCNTCIEAHNGVFYKLYRTNVWKSYDRGVSWQDPVDLVKNGKNFGKILGRGLIQTAGRRLFTGGATNYSDPSPVFYTGHVLSSRVIWNVPKTDAIGYLSFSKSETLNGGQVLYEFSFSQDNAQSWSAWNALTDESLSAVPVKGTGDDRLRIRMTITATNRMRAPEIDFLRVEYLNGEKEDLGEALVAPNPVSMAKGENRVTFFNLPALVNLRVYSAIGGKVAEIMNIPTFSGRFQWDLKNDQGEFIKSGVYLCELEDPLGNVKKLKLAVTR